jgi:hypothetical protein
MDNQQLVDNYDEENWVALYNAALIELEHPRMHDRIEEARTEIVARVEKLQGMPGLHTAERRALSDALNSLRVLELEEARSDANKQRHASAPSSLKNQNEENQE